MLFNSYIFCLFFLPIVVIAFYAVRKTGRYLLTIVFLLCVSLAFYGYASKEHPKHFLLFVAGMGVNYLVYRLFEYMRKQGKMPLPGKGLLLFAICGNLGILLLFKYYNFFVGNVNMIFHTELGKMELAAPLGISFLTFTQIAFVVDAYRGEIPGCSFLEYAAYTAFFPRVSSGPITRYQELGGLLKKLKDKKTDWNWIASGIYLFSMGLGKKVLLADFLGSMVDWGYSNVEALNAPEAFLVMVGYSFQLYFDFSGYSDMAIGISRILNLDLPINFNSPYQSATIIEFWKRWHITLTGFLTRYLYIPLGGNRKGKLRTCINTLIVFLCSGLWHGANWTFIFWGLLHGLFMILSRRVSAVFDKIPLVLNKAFTFLFVSLAWILFRSDSFSAAGKMYRALFRGGQGAGEELYRQLWLPLWRDAFGWSIPVWIDTIIVFLFSGFLIFFCKNAEERSRTLHYGIFEGAAVIMVFILSIFTFSGASSYIYAGF